MSQCVTGDLSPAPILDAFENYSGSFFDLDRGVALDGGGLRIFRDRLAAALREAASRRATASFSAWGTDRRSSRGWLPFCKRAVRPCCCIPRVRRPRSKRTALRSRRAAGDCRRREFTGLAERIAEPLARLAAHGPFRALRAPGSTTGRRFRRRSGRSLFARRAAASHVGHDRSAESGRAAGPGRGGRSPTLYRHNRRDRRRRDSRCGADVPCLRVWPVPSWSPCFSGAHVVSMRNFQATLAVEALASGRDDDFSGRPGHARRALAR